MKVGIMQPYFMPYIGYWQLICAVDKYVVYNDVNFVKGWANRNNLILNGEKKLFSVSLNGASQNKLFNEIEIADDFKKFNKTLQFNYGKAPFYNDIMELLGLIFTYPDRRFDRFILNSIAQTLIYLNINKELIMSSSIEKDCSLKGQNKILDICKRLGADTYINAIGGQELYDRDIFAENGIELKFLQPNITPYGQFDNNFIPSLSMIDILMFNSPDKINQMLENYTLI